jgi:hypothetical protein
MLKARRPYVPLRHPTDLPAGPVIGITNSRRFFAVDDTEVNMGNPLTLDLCRLFRPLTVQEQTGMLTSDRVA